MSMLIVYTLDCPKCGHEAETRTLDLSNPDDDGEVRIDVEMAAAQSTFRCTNDECGATVYTGDLDMSTDDD